MLKLDGIYCEGMVLQRGKTNRIAGRAEDGQIITVYFRGHKYQGNALKISPYKSAFEPFDSIVPFIYFPKICDIDGIHLFV